MHCLLSDTVEWSDNAMTEIQPENSKICGDQIQQYWTHGSKSKCQVKKSVELNENEIIIYEYSESRA